MRVRYLILLFIIFLIDRNSQAQIRFGGTPVFKSSIKNLELSIPFIDMPQYKLMKDEISNDLKSLGCKFAHSFSVNLNTDNCGKWDDLDDGSKVWHLGIRSKGAYSINLIFEKFEIPDGAQLFIYNPGQTYVAGAFTNKSHLLNGAFNTEPVPGDEIIVEYIEPSHVKVHGEIAIGAVNHDYKGILTWKTDKVGIFGDSEDCEVDVNCIYPEMKEKNAVCKVIVDGRNVCTGTIINNTSNDGTPYFITAAHCLDSLVIDHTFLFYFNYQVPSCENYYIEGTSTQSLSGAQIRAAYDSLDFLLVEMSQIPPLTYQPYWSGWTLNDSPKAPVHTIHHPMGDVKKFSRSVNDPTHSSYLGELFHTDSHWRISEWKTGTTEGGSSGCGLFDEDGRLFGTLSGGSADCNDPVNDYFERFNKAWNFMEADDQQLKVWLDPLNNNPEYIDGYNYYEETELVRISNIQQGDSAVINDPERPGFGNWLGNNDMNTTGFADLYPQIDSAIIRGIYVMAGKLPLTAILDCRMRIWSDTNFVDAISPVLDTTINLFSFRSSAENFVELYHPVFVKNPVSVTFEYDLPKNGDSMGFYWQYNSKRKNNTLYIKDDQYWIPFNQINSSSLNASAYVDLLASDAYINENKIDNEPEDHILVFFDRYNSIVNFKWGINKLELLEVYSIKGEYLGSSKYGYRYGNDHLSMANYPTGIYIFKFTFQEFIKTRIVTVYH